MEELNEAFNEKGLNYIFQLRKYSANDIGNYGINELFSFPYSISMTN